MSDDLAAHDGIALGELIDKGEIRSSELIETVIARIEKINPAINAVVYKLYDQAREEAKKHDGRGAETHERLFVFQGVPFLLKDLIAESKGTPFSEFSIPPGIVFERIDLVTGTGATPGRPSINVALRSGR